MVEFWKEMLDIAIKTSKRRIIILEKHGIGLETMAQKKILQIQLKDRENK